MTTNVLGRKFNAASILRFSIPNVIMMVFLSLYTIVDGIFIARFAGELPLSAANMFYPVTSVQLGIGIMLASGGSAVIAQKMGQGKKEEAREDFTCIVMLGILIGFLFTVFCIPFLKPILRFLGTSDIQMQDCYTYAKILLYFSPLMFLQTLFHMLFVTDGRSTLGLCVIGGAGVANMVLDYVFMGPLQMGIAGAAWATGIGYSIPAIFGMVYFTLKRNDSLCFVRFPVRGKMILRACANGSSEMVGNTAVAVTTFLFNIICMHYWGESGVAAFGIFGYNQFVFSAIFLGFSSGIAPIISYKYGANDILQLKYIARFGLIFIICSSVCNYFLSLALLRPVLSIFTDTGSELYQIALDGFPIYAIQYLFMGIGFYTSSLFTALGDGLSSGIVSFLRTFLFLVGCILLLPYLIGEMGVWLATPVAELLGVLVSAGFLIAKRKKYHY